MKFKLGILALLIFLSSCASHSRKDSYPVFPLAKNSDKSYGLEEMTGQALEYKMKGDYKKSYMLFKSILSRLEEKYEFLSQIYLHFMNYLAIDTSLEEEYLDFLQQYIKGNTSSGRDLAMYFLMGAWEKRALREKALKISDELGFITQWYLLGPFKNEGRNGLDYTLPPEFEIDLGKTYTESAYHPLRWRKINSSLGGPIDLNNYLTPDKNSLAFLLTYIQVPESGYYTVALGTDDGYMLWINDRLINKNDIYRKGYFDQEKFRVFLNKGLNRILLKLSQEYQNFELYFRIFPVDFQVVLTGSETFTPQDNSKQPAYPVAIKEKSFPDLEEKIPFLKEFFLGYYYFITGNFPDNKKMDAFWFQKALEKEKASLFYYYAALASSENEDFKKYMNRAIDVDRNNREAWLRLGIFYFNYNYYDQALKIFDKIIADNPDYLSAYFYRGKLFFEMKLDHDAYHDFQVCVEKDQYEADSLYYLGHIYLRKKEYTLAGESFLQSFNLRPVYFYLDNSSYIQRYLQIIKQKEKIPSFYLEKISLHRDSVEQGIDLARYYLFNNKINEAMETIKACLDQDPYHQEALKLASDIAIKGNDKDQAVKFLKQLLKTKPHDKNIKRRILYLTGTQQNLIDRFSVDVEQKIKKIFSQGLDTYKKKYRSPGITPYRGKIVKVSDDGTTETLVTVLYYIINPRGAEIFKKEKINYVPDNEELEIIKAQTITRKGARTDSKDENTYSLIDTDKNLYYNYLAREISFANVKADTIILLQYTIWSKAGSQLEKSYYGNSEIFADFYPVQEKDYTLIFPRKMNIFYKYDHFKKKPKFKKSRYAAYYIYQWRQKDLFQLNYEPNMGSPFSFVPQLHLTSFKNWNELSGWLRQLSESQKQLNSTMRSVVDKMKNDSQTKEEMIAKIYRYVRDVIRYVGLEYGLGGIRPRNAISVYSSRFGDCKDKAVLLNAMLQYAGIESYLGLVSSSQRGETMFDIPEIGLFDHAICLAFHDGKDYFLDATAMYHDFNEFPYYDRMNKILLLKGDGTFITPPRPDIDQNQYQAFTTGTINTVGKFSLKRKISAIGQFAPTFRYFASDPSYHKQYVENRWNNLYPGTVILSIDNKKASKPLFEYDIEINHFTDPIPGGFKFKPVLNRSEIFEKYFTLNKRQYPLVLNFPYTIQETIDISFSHDKIMTIKIPDNVDLKSKYFSLKIEYEKKENKISFRYLLKINKIKIYPDEYTRARKMALKIKNAEEKYIRVLW